MFFGGKGGVGKTTCSAALALWASEQGRRVLLVSTDPAHSTSDVLGTTLGPDVTEVMPGLSGLEIDPEREARRYLDDVKARLTGLFAPGVIREAARQIELAASMPGVADVALFDRMADVMMTRAGEFDLVVFDTAPTGHSLRLLRMPELMTTWIEALARRRREANAGMAAAGQVGTGAEPAPDPVLALLDQRAARLGAVRDELANGERVGFVLVLVPERLPIEETVRARQALEDSRMHVDGLVVNRVLPDEASGSYFEARKSQERVYLDEIDRRLSGTPRAIVPLLPTDVHGLETLRTVGTFLFSAARPDADLT